MPSAMQRRDRCNRAPQPQVRSSSPSKLPSLRRHSLCRQGQGPGYRCGLLGLVALVMRELRGVELPSYAEQYVTAADRVAMARLIEGRLDAWSTIVPGQEQTFDGVLTREGRFPRHIGIVTSPRQLHETPSASGGALRCPVRVECRCPTGTSSPAPSLGGSDHSLGG